jgi:hypothetical protein
MPRYIALALLLVAAAGTGAARAQDADAAQRAFVERYAATLVAQDREGLKTLFHPASLACINAENRDYYDSVFAKELSYGASLRGGYTLTRFAPLGAYVALDPTGGMFPNPVQPTHQFQLDTPFDSKNRSVTVMRTVVARDGAWFIVLGCPTPKGVAMFREQRLEGERQQAQARRLAGALQEPALSEIRDFLAHNRRIDAIKRYRAATDADLATATQVIDVLDNR